MLQLKWDKNTEQHYAMARTSFAELRVEYDWPSVRQADNADRYEGRVTTINGVILQRRANIETMYEALEWCESAYADLLLAELRGMDALP
jgi:hypothetical protein